MIDENNNKVNFEQEYLIAKKDYERIKDTVKDNYVREGAKEINDSFVDLLKADKEAFLDLIITGYKDYENQKLQEAENKLREIEQKAKEQKNIDSFNSVVTSWQAKNPNQNAQELLAFFEDELPPKIQREIANNSNNDGEAFFDAILAKKQEINGNNSDVKMPQKFEGSSRADGDVIVKTFSERY